MIKRKILFVLVAVVIAYSGSSSAFGNLYDETTIKPNPWGDGGYQIQDNLGRTKQRCKRNSWDGSVTCTDSPY